MSVQPELANMLAEARAMLRDHVKSNSSAALTRLVVRSLETQVLGAPRTPHPSRHHGEDDGLGLGQR